jgi:hypothetical protein
MTGTPKNQKSEERSSSDGATAMDYVRTKQEAEAQTAKRDAEAKLAQTKTEGSPSSPESGSRRHRSDEPDDTLQDTTDEPIVEDEP